MPDIIGHVYAVTPTYPGTFLWQAQESLSLGGTYSAGNFTVTEQGNPATSDADVNALIAAYVDVATPFRQNAVVAHNDYRLTLTTGVAVTNADVTSSTLYWVGTTGNITIWDTVSSQWFTVAASNLSLALSGLTADKNYDCFLKQTYGTLSLALSAAWTNDTTRADALALQGGIWVKASDLAQRWLGIMRAASATTTTDSVTRRWLCNGYNPVPKHMFSLDQTDISTTSATYGQVGSIECNYLSDGTHAADFVGVALVGTAGAWSAKLTIGDSTTPAGTATVGANIGSDSDHVTTVCREMQNPGCYRRRLIYATSSAGDAADINGTVADSALTGIVFV